MDEAVMKKEADERRQFEHREMLRLKLQNQTAEGFFSPLKDDELFYFIVKSYLFKHTIMQRYLFVFD